MTSEPPDFERIQADLAAQTAHLREVAKQGGIEQPEDRRRRRVSEIVALGIILAVIAVNALWFAAIDLNYFTWFVENGSLIALLFAIIASAVALDGHVGLIAADPLNFTAEILMIFTELAASLGALFGLPRSGLALADAGLSALQTRFRSQLMDLVLAWIFLAVFGAAMLAWAIVVAPLQYFLNLVCGAPARTAAASRTTIWRVNRGNGHTEYLRTPKELSEFPESDKADIERERDRGRAVQMSFAMKPVTLTSAISAVALWGAAQVI
jgi:hypothetical protein